MHRHASIFPISRTIFRWLLLLALTTGSFIFREISGDSFYRTEQVFSTRDRANSCVTFGEIAGRKPSATAVQKSLAAGRELHLARLFSLRNVTLVSFAFLKCLFISYLFLLLQKSGFQIRLNAYPAAHPSFF